MNFDLNLLIIIVITLAFGLLVGYIFAKIISSVDEKYRASQSIKKQRSILGGLFSQQLAHYLPDFPEDLKPTESRFIGNPIDFIVYKGLDDKNITEVVFVEVKSGKSRFNENEKSLKDTIDNKRVRWITYRVPDKVIK